MNSWINCGFLPQCDIGNLLSYDFLEFFGSLFSSILVRINEETWEQIYLKDLSSSSFSWWKGDMKVRNTLLRSLRNTDKKSKWNRKLTSLSFFSQLLLYSVCQAVKCGKVLPTSFSLAHKNHRGYLLLPNYSTSRATVGQK